MAARPTGMSADREALDALRAENALLRRRAENALLRRPHVDVVAGRPIAIATTHHIHGPPSAGGPSLRGACGRCGAARV